MSIFHRLFKFVQAESHSAIDKLEDPVKQTEQGIRDLKSDLQSSIKSLAEAKAVCTGMRRKSNEHKEIAAEYEKKAILLLQKAEKAELDPTEADRLAGESLNKKETALKRASDAAASLNKQEELIHRLEATVSKLKSQISHWENELVMLKSRAKVASATKRLNKQLTQIDSSSTVSMLEKMKSRIDEDEAIAESYGEIANLETSIDSEIDKAIGSDQASTDDKLAALKAKLAKKG